MQLYNAANPIFWHPRKAGQLKDTLNKDLLPSHADMDSWARLILLLVHSQAQGLWSAAANPAKQREAHDNPELNLQEYTELVETKIMADFFNNSNNKAPTTVDLSVYDIKIVIDASKPPKLPKSVVWMRESRQKLRRLMTVCSKNFNKSGSGQQGIAAVDADTLFWVFCHRDILVMFMWLAWQRGHNLPAHCTIILPEDEMIDIGVKRHVPESPKRGGSSQSYNAEFQSLKQSLTMHVQQSAELLHIMKQPSTPGSSISAKVGVQAKLGLTYP
jgi:hypothetical protein